MRRAQGLSTATRKAEFVTDVMLNAPISECEWAQQWQQARSLLAVVQLTALLPLRLAEEALT